MGSNLRVYQRCVCVCLYVATTPAIKDMYWYILIDVCGMILYYGVQGMQPAHTPTHTYTHMDTLVFIS